MSSTASWYKLTKQENLYFTRGIVFVENHYAAIPLSLTGAEIIITSTYFQITTQVSYTSTEGNPYGNVRTSDCWSFPLTSRDIQDFLGQNSFTRTIFKQLERQLPDWLKFKQSGKIEYRINDISTSLQRGRDAENEHCTGAPLFPDRLYSIFRFASEFELSVYGQQVNFPEPQDNKKFCIIVEVCNDDGGSVFLVLPEKSIDLLDKVTVFKTLSESKGWKIKPTGFGISLQRNIDVNVEKGLQLVDKNDLFHYP